MAEIISMVGIISVAGVFQKYKTRGLFSEFYGMSRLEINSWARKKITEMSGGETCPRIKTSAKQISFWVRKPKFIDKCRIIFSAI